MSIESKTDSRRTFKICAEKRLAEYLRTRGEQVQARIDQDSDDYLANADETAYIHRLANEFCLEVPYLDFGRVSASTGKKRVPAERFPPNQFDVRKGKSYEKGVVIFHIPCTGDVELLRYYTDSFIAENGPLGFIEDNHLCFEIINFHDDLTRVKKSSEAVIKDIKTLSSKVIGEIESHNFNLVLDVRLKLHERKRKLSQVVEVLGVPIRKSENVRTEPSATRLPQTANEVTVMEINDSYDVFLSYASGDSKERRTFMT